jgi:transcriptional regulator with XRE-family HTH domain
MKQPAPSRIGRAIRSARERAGLDQKTLARRAKVSQPYLCHVETRAVSPNAPAVVRLARVLGADPLAWLRMARPDDFRAWAAAFEEAAAR